MIYLPYEGFIFIRHFFHLLCISRLNIRISDLVTSLRFPSGDNQILQLRKPREVLKCTEFLLRPPLLLLPLRYLIRSFRRPNLKKTITTNHKTDLVIRTFFGEMLLSLFFIQSLHNIWRWNRVQSKETICRTAWRYPSCRSTSDCGENHRRFGCGTRGLRRGQCSRVVGGTCACINSPIRTTKARITSPQLFIHSSHQQAAASKS